MVSKFTSSQPAIGIIGGTGLYDLPELEHSQWVAIDSAFGLPSDELMFGEIDGVRLVFLPRHGRGHRLSPTEINYRANIEVLKRAGVTQIISFSAVGSLNDQLKPGTFVMVDQFIDRTFSRNKTFFGDGLVAHVSMAQPVCGRMVGSLTDVSDASSIEFCSGGTYLVMEGPQFSTLAESELYRSWGADVIGMTNMPEAKLAREAELCYSTVAMVTDYDCWHPDHENVSVGAIMRVLEENLENARILIRGVAQKLAAHSGPCIDQCDRSLEHAITTTQEARRIEAVGRLRVVADRVLTTRTE